MTQQFSREEYHARIRWIILIRAVLAVILLGTLAFFHQRYNIYTFSISALNYLFIAVALLTASYLYLLKKIINLHVFAYVQIFGDILIITYLVNLTGGTDSGFSVLYHLSIISASIILYRRGGYLAASLASILYGGMLDMQYYNAFGFTQSQNFTPAQVMYLVLINIISFYVVAFLSGYLSDRLRKTRQALREKSTDFEDLRAFQENILRSVGSGIVTMDLGGQVTSWNLAAEQITGYTYDEIKTRWQEVFGESIKGFFGHTDDLKEQAVRFNGEMKSKSGQKLILGMTASLLKDERGSVRGVIFTFQDMTKIIEMEDRVRRQERLATIGGLAAGIAHEIRNPLASLSGSIQVLQKDLDLKEDNQHLMEIVIRETERLNTIITEFLEYARPKASSLEQISLASLVDETVMLLKNNRNFRPDITISCDIDSSLMIKAEPQRMRQVFWNMLLNACEAIPNGGEIAIRSRIYTVDGNNPDWIEISIADTGQGIRSEDCDKIFYPFFTTKTGGTGLGLAIAYRIIEDHGGTITVESESGKGTKFRISFPLAEEAMYAYTKKEDAP